VPTAAEELRRLLVEFNEENGADLSMVLTRTGTSIAHEGSGAVNADTFASLAATLMNAAEVMYAGLGRPAPSRILVESEKATLVASGVGTRAMFVAVGGDREKILQGIAGVTEGVRSVLAAKA
jgi:predicted regulator of Ras-like GTPase activity (Roadblock/LC7/MglB family)